MKPNNANGRLPHTQRPIRVLVISGSNRRQYNCPGVDSKARALMLRMADRLPQEWEIDFEDPCIAPTSQPVDGPPSNRS